MGLKGGVADDDSTADSVHNVVGKESTVLSG